jgi:hypothetical protein
MHTIHCRCLALLVATALCAACGKDSTAGKAAPAPAQATTSKAAAAAAADTDPLQDAEKQTAGMVHGVSPGKPTAPVDLKFSLAAKPLLGTPLTIDVALIATGSSDSMTLSLQASDELAVDAATSLASFPKSLPGALYRHQVKVTPRAEGAFFVNVLVTTAVPGGPQSRSFSIPVLVGGIAALDKP